jgi:argininosuccinate lyase
MKLWQKNTTALASVDAFTVGNDRKMDLYLAPYDVLGSIAHITMLQRIGLLTNEELEILRNALRQIHTQIVAGNFTIADDVEDVHSQIELLLTSQLGDVGKKIHAARSRNDQVLVAIKLFLRAELQALVQQVHTFFALLQQQSEAYKTYLLPGYTHMQLAMPSSFGLWFGAYAEALIDDVVTLKAAYDVVNKNPLGSAAGYGSSFPIDRTYITQLLGFETLNYNVVYAQMGRGKAERIVAQALGNIADTLARMSTDMCLYLNQNFSFVSFPSELTTGSSIMPHKKNPDVFELIRAKCNTAKAIATDIQMLTTNLPSGYHRDMQLLKEKLFPAFQTLHDCITMATLMLSNITVKDNIMEAPMYAYAFSVEAVNNLVLQGVPFRDAYKQVGLAIEAGTFVPTTDLQHTHEGSIGNLCTSAIAKQMQQVVASFPFGKVNAAEAALLA